jgi:hypothetical protein
MQPYVPRARLPDRTVCPYRQVMPTQRCLWCTDPPFEEVAVLKWRGPSTGSGQATDQERLTVQLCRKHLDRLRKAGAKGRETKGWYYKLGWW